MKLSAVLIAKNEEKVIGRCIKSLVGADEIVVLDTGSRDRTVEVARSLGAKVQVMGPMIPFHFANARNAAHEQASNDWILVIDADEVLRQGMLVRIRRALEEYPSATAFSVTFTDRGAITHKKKLYRKSVWNWRYRVHEQLEGGKEEDVRVLENVVFEHLPSPDKTFRRRQNIDLLRITIQEDPDYVRAYKHLGQELMLDKQYQEAIPFLATFLEKTDEDALQKSEVMMRIGQCYGELKQLEDACRWFDFSAKKDPRRREPLYHGAWYMMANARTAGDLMTACDFLKRCLAIEAKKKPGTALDQPAVWTKEPEKMLAFCQKQISEATPSIVN